MGHRQTLNGVWPAPSKGVEISRDNGQLETQWRKVDNCMTVEVEAFLLCCLGDTITPMVATGPQWDVPDPHPSKRLIFHIQP